MAQQPRGTLTEKWKNHQKCEIYSRSQKRWIEGKVIDIFTDEEGQWVKVKYGRQWVKIHDEAHDVKA